MEGEGHGTFLLYFTVENNYLYNFFFLLKSYGIVDYACHTTAFN